MEKTRAISQVVQPISLNTWKRCCSFREIFCFSAGIQISAFWDMWNNKRHYGWNIMDKINTLQKCACFCEFWLFCTERVSMLPLECYEKSNRGAKNWHKNQQIEHTPSWGLLRKKQTFRFVWRVGASNLKSLIRQTTFKFFHWKLVLLTNILLVIQSHNPTDSIVEGDNARTRSEFQNELDVTVRIRDKNVNFILCQFQMFLWYLQKYCFRFLFWNWCNRRNFLCFSFHCIIVN